jgi:2-polyprenyl-6-hydroxyphenyl methylase/3-demethylubiquinone-9 3-methyltransferase
MSAVGNNADRSELGKFDSISSRFWDTQGEFRPLHILNPIRAQFVADRAKLAGMRVLDVGCGGGLLCEALARAGARVTGIDLAPGMIEVAQLHAAEQGLDITYKVIPAEEIGGRFDVVTCMEMLEHVPDPGAVIDACARLLRPGGQLFVSTLNRTPAAFALAVVGAEYIARLLPRGTHHYQDFIRPSELGAWLRRSGLQLEDVSGLTYEPWRNRARLTARTDVNYLACAVKPALD